ncbi:MAG TPA: aldo/keto reductase, partial [Nitrosopumilaceae archaeon]|nr:aldo/keto reductase [Nitrosopumilaceae archaeon]
KTKGLVKKIGVSVYGNEQFQEAARDERIDLIQFPYNLLDNFSQRGENIRKAKEAGKELHVRSVFLQGLFFMEESKIPEKIKPLKPWLKEIHEIAKEAEMSVQELAMSYVLQNSSIDKVLIGVDSQEQLESNIDIVTKMKNIPFKTLKQIDQLDVMEVELLSPVNWK